MAESNIADMVQTRLECALTAYNRSNGTNTWHDRDQEYAISVNGGMMLARVNGMGVIVSYKKFVAHIQAELEPWKVDLISRHFGVESEPSYAIAVNTDPWNSNGLTESNSRASSSRRRLIPQRLQTMGCCTLTLLLFLLALAVQVLYALAVPLISGAQREPTYR